MGVSPVHRAKKRFKTALSAAIAPPVQYTTRRKRIAHLAPGRRMPTSLRPNAVFHKLIIFFEKVPCEAGKYPNAIRTSCISCPHTMYIDPTSVCRSCEGKAVPLQDQSGCELCQGANYPVDGGTKCGTCPANTIYKALDLSCEICGSKEIPSENQSVCKPCLAGQQAIKGGIECGVCGPHFVYVEEDRICFKCKEGEFSDKEINQCGNKYIFIENLEFFLLSKKNCSKN